MNNIAAKSRKSSEHDVDCLWDWEESRWRGRLRQNLLKWFEAHRRDLPWRARPGDRLKEPYAVWISEIMLQQTQVATVIPYYERFISRFPTVADLATASEEEVLKHWEGLGYYRRARQMHAAAKQIIEAHDGCFPEDFDSVLALPGVGRYTAGAILSISRGQRLPVVEANTLRLYSRLIALRNPPTSAPAQRVLWDFAECILPKSNSGIFNQAAMELGSLLCTPREPSCHACPLKSRCGAFSQSLQAEIPGKVKKIKYEQRHEVALVVRSKDRYLIRQCGQKERWAGLWDFPRFNLIDDSDTIASGTDFMERQFGLGIQSARQVKTIKHAVTKYRITLNVLMCEASDPNATCDESALWKSKTAISELPLSTSGRKIARLLE